MLRRSPLRINIWSQATTPLRNNICCFTCSGDPLSESTSGHRRPLLSETTYAASHAQAIPSPNQHLVTGDHSSPKQHMLLHMLRRSPLRINIWSQATTPLRNNICCFTCSGDPLSESTSGHRRPPLSETTYAASHAQAIPSPNQ